MRESYNSKKDYSKKVYAQPSIKKLGLILDKTKTNDTAMINRDNAAMTGTTWS